MIKRIIIILTAASVIFSPMASVLTYAETAVPEKKQYVIITKDKEVYEGFSEEVSESIIMEAFVFKRESDYCCQIDRDRSCGIKCRYCH